jgi:beta-glucosidase-like glycosyl hydrolase
VNPAELLVPALRWNAERGYSMESDSIDDALELGVGGFIFFGGPAGAVTELTRDLRKRSRSPLLIGADLERGAGQQFAGCTGLPPLAALGSLESETVMRNAGALTASEARGLGLNWIYAPDLDLDIEPENPIVGTRSIGHDPNIVARLGAAWIDGCQSHRVLACGKHFPGHGRTTTDSHAELPAVATAAGELEATDLVPFSAAARAGVASVMTAHVAFPALDPASGPATLSSPILRGLLRERLGFTGLVVTDALIMAGVQQGSERSASVQALAAGCDLLLYPAELRLVVAEITGAIRGGMLHGDELERSIARRREWAQWAAADPAEPAMVEIGWAADVARRVVYAVRGSVQPSLGSIRVTIIDDDVGGPYPPPSREPFTTTLARRGVQVVDGTTAEGHIIALFGDIRAWKGRPGYSDAALERVKAALSGSKGEVVIVQFSHPRLAAAIPGTAPVVCAWGGEAAMQVAAAEWLTGKRGRN